MSTEYVCLLFYDLPCLTGEERLHYRVFHRQLVKLGFYQLQESVYFRHKKSKQAITVLLEQLKVHCPAGADVRALMLSTSQFQQMHTLIGNVKLGEIITNKTQRVLEV